VPAAMPTFEFWQKLPTCKKIEWSMQMYAKVNIFVLNAHGTSKVVERLVRVNGPAVIS
jgi:hypothetical protein